MILEIFLGIVLIGLYLFASRRPKHFPPGPKGLPLLGYVPFIKKHDSTYLYKGFMKMSEIYGPVVGFYMGPRQACVSVCDYDAVKEVLHSEDFSGRFDTNLIKLRTFGQRLGYIFTDGEFWQEQRRFALRHLRDLGFGRTSSESMIQEEIHDLMSDIRVEMQRSDGIVDFKGFFNMSLLNVLWALIGGERFKRNDAKLKKLLDAVDLFFRTGNAVGGDLIIPQFLMRWFPVLKKFSSVQIELFEPIQQFIGESIEEHKNSRREGEPRDFIDVYLSEIDKTVNQKDSTFHKNQLIAGIMDLFIAGAETTSNSIGFFLLYMIHHPEIQLKVQMELDEMCGNSLPLLEHRTSLTYTEAVLMEAQRLSNVAPLGVPHTAMKDTQLQGYFIPKGTFAFLNFYSLHMDQSYWTDPEVFRPERHLNSSGKLVKFDHFMPFGGGKRMCLGESLARNTYYLFTTALLKTFEFKRNPHKPIPTLLPKYGLTNAYDGFEAIVVSRQ